MKKSTIALLATATIFGLSGCGNDTPSSSSAKTYAKTPAEVFTQSCHKCHGEQAQGLTEKKTPPMNDRQAGELELDLYDVKNDGLNQSSGTEHDKMAHNMKKLLEKGFDYDPKAMAEYIEKNFYKMPSKEVTITEEVKEATVTTEEAVKEAVTEATETITEAAKEVKEATKEAATSVTEAVKTATETELAK